MPRYLVLRRSRSSQQELYEKVGVDGIFARRFLSVTVGALALVSLSAIAALSIITIMPDISAELSGDAFYSLAFAAPISAGIVGMVAAGAVIDRRGPRVVLYLAVAFLAIGLLFAGVAGDMPTFVAGRFIQGLGAGGISVSIYIIIARVYPPRLQPKVFAAFSAAWLVPSLIGPFVAGAISQAVGWRWIFLGIVALVVVASLLLIPAVRGMRSPAHDRMAWPVRRLAFAGLAAIAVPAISLLFAVPGGGLWLCLLAALLSVVAYTRLVPRGTIRLVSGLPALMAFRALTAAAFFGSEVYLPYLLSQEYGFSISLSGLSLMLSASGWFVGAQLQARSAARLSHAASIRVGSTLVAIAAVLVAGTAWLTLVPFLAIAAWMIAGVGMGLLTPRISVAVIEATALQEQGVQSSSMFISDNLGSALALALSGVLTGVMGLDGVSIGLVFAAAAAPAGIVALAAGRARSTLHSA
jgi:MFS family permease